MTNYQAPSLTLYGSVEQLTRVGGGGSSGDQLTINGNVVINRRSENFAYNCDFESRGSIGEATFVTEGLGDDAEANCWSIYEDYVDGL